MNTYLTTAIHYVNAPPHLGHAYEWVYADAIARSLRASQPLRFLTGTDENSLKNVRAAEAAGRTVRDWVDENAARFAVLATRLGVSNDDFIRTTEPRHHAGVEALWRACAASGDLEQRTYAGLYCVGCEAFYAPEDLVDGRCGEHPAPLEWVEEENWFFRLSKYGPRLAELIRDDRLAIVPQRAKNEALAFIARGLEDISVSRSLSRARGWGVPVPDDPGQVIYVWFDALANYVSALGGARPVWWDGASERIHVIGKGINRFHAVYWPSILLSAGVPLPTQLVVHGYLTVDGKKIGKSLGNAVDPERLIDRYGVDALRYYLLRHFRPFEDGDFSEQRLWAVFEAELADQLGNLVERVAALLLKCGGTIPRVEPSPALEVNARSACQRYRPDEALDQIWSVVQETNRALTERQPWVALRSGQLDSARESLCAAVASIRAVSRALVPLLPETAARIERRLGGDRVEPGPLLFDKRTLVEEG